MNKMFTYRNEKYTQKNLMKLLNISYSEFNHYKKIGFDKFQEDRSRVHSGARRKLYDFNGSKFTVYEIAEFIGISVNGVRKRIKENRPLEAGSYRRTKINRSFEYKGEMYSLNELANKYNLTYGAVRMRLKNGKPLEEPLGTQSKKTEK